MVHLVKRNLHACPMNCNELHERARVLRVALATLQKHVRQGVMLEGEMTTKANSLIPLGAGLMVGLTARPFPREGKR